MHNEEVPIEPGVEAHACNTSMSEVEAVELGVQSHHWLHSKFKMSTGYMRPCLKKQQVDEEEEDKKEKKEGD